MQWHTAMPNTSERERKLLVVNLVPFWHKQFGPVVEGAQRLAARGLLDTPLRRKVGTVVGCGCPPARAAGPV